MNKQTKEGGKEFLRILLISIIPILLLYAESGTFDWKPFGMALAVAVLKASDKFLHTMGKETGNVAYEKGLTRF